MRAYSILSAAITLALIALLQVEANQFDDLYMASQDLDRVQDATRDPTPSEKRFMSFNVPKLIKKWVSELQSTSKDLTHLSHSMIDTLIKRDVLGGLKRWASKGLTGNLNNFDPEIENFRNSLGALKEADQGVRDGYDCAVRRLNRKHLTKMTQVLTAAIRQIVVGQPSVNEPAIIDQLAKNKFVVDTDYYQPRMIKANTKVALIQLYEHFNDLSEDKVAKGHRNIMEPSQFESGRLIELCNLQNKVYTLLSVNAQEHDCGGHLGLFQSPEQDEQRLNQLIELCPAYTRSFYIAA